MRLVVALATIPAATPLADSTPSSSPLARGTLPPLPVKAHLGRFIPTRAGNTREWG